MEFTEHAVRGEPVRTHCPYCALQCGIQLSGAPAEVTLRGDDFPVNNGELCVKGFTAAATLSHSERLTTPLLRRARTARLEPASWEEALAFTARRLRETQEQFGAASAGVFGSGALTNEKSYLLGKFARLALRTPNIDYNGRFCMSSGAAAANLALGLDRGLPFPLEDIPGAEVVLLVGGNPAETMPPLMQYFDALRARGGKLVVVDPRRSATANLADVHLRLTPGSDAVLANGLLHLLIREDLLDRNYIESRTEGFEAVRAVVATYWPERVERLAGIPEAQLLQVARMLGAAGRLIILTGRGPEQQSQGVANALSFINLALALGKVGAPGSGYGCLTGQGNGQGGREHGQKADQLPGYRHINDPAARAHVAAVWGVAESEIPGAGKSAYELLAGDDLHALLVVGSNVVVSSPDSQQVTRKLQSLEFLAVADFFLSETAELADVVFPVAQWAEEEGTMTNLEGRVLHRRRAFSPPAGVRTDLELLCGLAQHLGAAHLFADASPRAVFEELRRATRGGRADYSGITYEKLDASDGVFWPCAKDEALGTPRLFADRFPTASGRARFHPVTHKPPAETPDAEYPLYLTTGRVLAQYQSGTQTRRIAALTRTAPRPLVQIHPSTAKEHSVSSGDTVTLRTRRGAGRFTVEVTRTIREDTLFVSFHWSGEESVNRLTNAALDPISKMPEFKVCAVRLEREAT
ncbi:MAG: molybdopterin oxidoreductase family protein [Myxococcaceae bacterium]